MAERDREGVLSEEAVPTTIRTVAKTVKLKQKYLFQRTNYRTTTNIKKNIMRNGPYSRGALKESSNKVLPPWPSNPDPA